MLTEQVNPFAAVQFLAKPYISTAEQYKSSENQNMSARCSDRITVFPLGERSRKINATVMYVIVTETFAKMGTDPLASSL